MKWYFHLKYLSYFSDEDIFHSIADGMDIMGKYVNKTMDELEEGTLGVYNETSDEVSLYYSPKKTFNYYS